MTVVSNEYANALFSLACESGCRDEVFESLKNAKEAIDKSDGFAGFVSSPSIPMEERIDVIKSAFSGKIHEYVLSALCLLCENKSFNIFNEFYSEFCDLYSKKANVSEAFVTSAVELSNIEISNLTEKLEALSGNKVEIKLNIDKSIIGGLIVNMDGNLYDGSIKSRIKSIKEVMNE